MSTDTSDTGNAFDETFSGEAVHVVDRGGHTERLDIETRTADPDWIDRELFSDLGEG